MSLSLGARNLVALRRIRFRQVTNRNVYLVVRRFEEWRCNRCKRRLREERCERCGPKAVVTHDPEVEVTIARETGTYSCLCENGSVWRFSKQPTVCYHAEAVYAMFKRLEYRIEELPLYLYEADGGPFDLALRHSIFSFLSHDYIKWKRNEAIRCEVNL